MSVSTQRSAYVCMCSHPKRAHILAKALAAAPCNRCKCKNFCGEPVCRCGHGLKAHLKGSCNQKYIDGCTAFRGR